MSKKMTVELYKNQSYITEIGDFTIIQNKCFKKKKKNSVE